MLDDFNSVMSSMKFTLEEEENNKINILDITITKGHDGLSLEIYRKLKTTDILIPSDSCHPNEHKTAAFRYFYDKMKMYKLTPESQQKKETRYNESWLITITKPLPWTKLEKKKGTQKRKWAKFTYIRKETRFITKLFKNTDVKVTFTTDNSIERRLARKYGTDHSKYDTSGIYQLTCPDCKMKYTG